MGHVAAHQLRQRSKAAPDEATQAPAVSAPLALQRAAGNQAVSELIAGAQAKLAVGAVDDPLEREADALAARVSHAVRSGTPLAPSEVAGPRLLRAPAAGTEAGARDLDSETEASLRAARAGGRRLPDAARTSLEEAFGGADFRAVRTHEGAEATRLNDAVGAKAFTVGSDIFFRDAMPGPGDPLLAHELTHVIQQGAGGPVVQRTTGVKKKGTPETKTETEKTPLGDVTTTKTKRQFGVAAESSSESDTFDGKTHTTTKAEHEAFAGAETAVSVIKRSTPLEIERAVEAMARAGAFGESSRKAAVTRGALKASAEGKASGSAGAEASFKGGAKVSANLYQALTAVMEAGAKAGVGGSLEGQLTAALGPLAASIKAQLSAFAGAMATFKASIDVGIDHLHAKAEGEAFAGAKAEGELEAKVSLGLAEAKGVLKGEAMAGAKASGEATLKIDLTGIEASVKAEAFAGVEAKATGTGEFGYRGRTIFKATGEVSVSAGIGGKASATFEFRNGKLKIGGELSATLGIGGGVEVGVEVDFQAIAFMIVDMIARAFAREKEVINRGSPKVPRVPIIDPELKQQKIKEGHDAYFADFKAYAAKKAKQGQSGIKRERVQEILDKRWSANKKNWQFLEFDEGIMAAAKEAFGGQLKDIYVQAGQLRMFEPILTEAQKAHLKAERMKKGYKF